MAESGAIAPLSPASVQLDAKNYRPQVTRSLRDLPAPANMMKAVAVIMTWTIMGLSDSEISEELGISPTELRQIRGHRAYAEAFEVVFSEFVRANSQFLQARIAAYGGDAVNTLAAKLSSKNELVQVMASKDLLDRSGLRPVDLAGKNTADQNEFKISIIPAEHGIDVNIKVK